ncbi:MAG TPA: hypothetical protein VGD85_13445, partial [Nocardioides sp.]
MPRKAPQPPPLILNVSLAGRERDYDETVTFLDRRFRVRRMGTDGDVDAAEELVRTMAPQAAAIAVTGVHGTRAAGRCEAALAALE